MSAAPPAVAFRGVERRYGQTTALAGLSFEVAAGEIFGLVGPDGAGKTTALELVCGLDRPGGGEVRAFGLDPAAAPERLAPLLGLVSQDFTLYGALTVEENLDFFAALQRVPRTELADRKQRLLAFSRLEPFRGRRAGRLSGGMKKKLALSCALLHRPRLLVLDEPSTGVDPVSRRELWEIVFGFLEEGSTVLVTTPYMDEAEQFHRIGLLAAGRLLALGTPDELRRSLDGEILLVRGRPLHRVEEAARTLPGFLDATSFGDRVHLRVTARATFLPRLRDALGAAGIEVEEARPIEATMEDVFLARSAPERGTADAIALREPARAGDGHGVAVRARGLTRRFGDFVAVDGIELEVHAGEIFGFLGPNGAGKTTTIKMLCGLLPPSSGEAVVAGVRVAEHPVELRRRVGYMSQLFSLYPDLTVTENLELYGGLYGVERGLLKRRLRWVLAMAGLEGRERWLTRDLGGGFRQRLALGAALLHAPPILFLDEPTSGVDPASRRRFWRLIYRLAEAGTTVFVTTHYMDEAEHCHRLALIYRGRIIALGSPRELRQRMRAAELLELECDRALAAVRVAKQQSYVWEASLSGKAVHVLVDEAAADAPRLASALAGAGIAVSRCEPVAPSLEDLFVLFIAMEDGRVEAPAHA